MAGAWTQNETRQTMRCGFLVARHHYGGSSFPALLLFSSLPSTGLSALSLCPHLFDSAPFILAPLPVNCYFPKGDRGKGSQPFSDNLVRSDLSCLLQSERMFREHTFLYCRSSVGVDGKFRILAWPRCGRRNSDPGLIIKKLPAGSKCRLREARPCQRSGISGIRSV